MSKIPDTSGVGQHPDGRHAVSNLEDNVVVVTARWLPRYGKHWYLFADVGVLAVSREMRDSSDLYRVLEEAGIEPTRLKPDDRPILKVTCPLCGRSDQPIPEQRPTVGELGLLRHR